MEKLGKQKLSDAVPQRQPKAGGGMGRKPKPPQQEQAEQTREAGESQKVRSADASKGVNRGHRGGR